MSVVLVTGATRGIGRAIVERCLRDGDTVIGIARDAEVLDAMRATFGASFVPFVLDLGDRSARVGLVERVIALASAIPDAFVSVAGNADYRPALEVDAASLDAHLELHLVAAFEIARDLSKAWIAAARHGSVVVLASTLSNHPAPFTLPYAVAKGALDAMVRSLALELAPHRIRVNAVAPGVVDTELVRANRPDELDPDARLAALAQVHPLGRLGRADEVAETVVHVLRAPWMTGSSVVLDGGLSLV